MEVDTTINNGNGRVVIGTDKSFIAVLIRGQDIMLSNDIQEIFKQEGFLLIGDGKTKISDLDLSPLTGKIDKARIYILAHGTNNNGVHSIDLYRTQDFFSKLAAYNPNTSVKLELCSCYAGAAESDVMALPEGSVLITYGAAAAPSVDTINDKIALQSLKNLSIDVIQDFIQNFVNTAQTATVSIKMANGIFRHHVKPPVHTLPNMNGVVEYLEQERSKFIEAYDSEFGTKSSKSNLLKIGVEEATEWIHNRLFYLVVNNDRGLIKELEVGQTVFADYINSYHQNIVTDVTGKGSPILLLAVFQGYDDLVRAMLKSRDIDVNVKGRDGHTALIYAAYLGYYNLVKALLESHNINVNIRNEEGNTALIGAIQKGHFSIAEALIKAPNSNVSIKNKEGNTALMYATHLGYYGLVKTILGLHNIDVNARNKSGATALNVALFKDNIDVTAALIASGKLKDKPSTPIYKTYVKLENLLGLDEETIKLLISPNARDAYEFGYVTVSTLVELSKTKIRWLTSTMAKYVYKVGLAVVEELAELTEGQLRELFSDAASYLYETGEVTLKDLLAEDARDIKRKTDLLLKGSYRSSPVPLKGLAKLTIEQLETLFSDAAFQLYNVGLTPQNLLAEKIRDINFNILKAYAKHICGESEESMDYIDRINEAHIGVLTSLGISYTCKAGHAKFHQLAVIENAAKIEILTSERARYLYREGMITFQELAGLKLEQIEKLFSNDAFSLYRTEQVIPQKLLAEDVIYIERKIQLLKRAKLIGLVPLKELAELAVEQIEVLFYDPACLLYATKKVVLQNLLAEKPINIKLNILKASAEHVCGEPKESFDYILDEDCIDLLASVNIAYMCKAGYAKFHEIMAIGDAQKIVQLASDLATEEVYRRGIATFHELAKLETQQIKEFISSALTASRVDARATLQYMTFLNKLSDTTSEQLLYKDSVDMCPAYLEYNGLEVMGSEPKDITVF